MSATPSRADTEAVACCVCHREGRPVYDLDPFGVLRCDRCSLVFVSPRLRPGLRPAAPTARNTALARRRIGALVRLTVRELGGPVEGSRLLDVGAGDESFARAASTAGFDVTRTGSAALDVAGTYDVVTAWHVLEAVPDPVEFWRAVTKLLAPDGVALFATADFAGLPSRLRKQRWRGLRPDERVWQFTAKTHRIVAGCGGLEVTELYRSPLRATHLGRLDTIVGVARPA
jgi:hypothetical protein